MAVMLYREPNQVKWVGIRPGHNGEQIAKSGAANNGTTIIHTVTAAKTFFLCGARLSAYSALAGVGCRLKVRDAGDVDQYFIFVLEVGTGAGFSQAMSFPVPIEIPAGYDICVVSDSGNVLAKGFIYGWEE